MKKELLVLTISTSFLFASIPTEAFINNLVKEIQPLRQGLVYKTLNSIKNPFLFVKPSTVKITKDESGNVVKTKIKGAVIKKSSATRRSRIVRFKLYATLNNSAKINNRWIDLNKKIGSYTLKKVTKAFVTLQKGSAKPITVYLNSSNKNIKLLTK